MINALAVRTFVHALCYYPVERIENFAEIILINDLISAEGRNANGNKDCRHC